MGIYTFRHESATTVTMTGQRVAHGEHAELVPTDVMQMCLTRRVHLRLGQHKLQLAIILIVPGSKLSVQIVIDRLLVGELRETHADRTNHIAQLEGILHHKQRQVTVEVIFPTFVSAARDKKVNLTSLYNIYIIIS